MKYFLQYNVEFFGKSEQMPKIEFATAEERENFLKPLYEESGIYNILKWEE